MLYLFPTTPALDRWIAGLHLSPPFVFRPPPILHFPASTSHQEVPACLHKLYFRQGARGAMDTMAAGAASMYRRLYWPQGFQYKEISDSTRYYTSELITGLYFVLTPGIDLVLQPSLAHDYWVLGTVLSTLHLTQHRVPSLQSLALGSLC